VEVVTQQSGVRIKIHNEGKPIPKELQPNIFEFRGSLEKRIGKRGWGVGLPVVYAIVESHNGKVEVDSSENSGTSFTIFLPFDSLKEKRKAA
jgi:signal transduction histidine kinase